MKKQVLFVPFNDSLEFDFKMQLKKLISLSALCCYSLLPEGYFSPVYMLPQSTDWMPFLFFPRRIRVGNARCE